MLKIYEYAGCSTCKKALKFLDEREVTYQKIAIVDQPPSLHELRRMSLGFKGDFKKLFNTAGLVYRELGLKEKIKKMSEEDALQLLAKHGKLVKRPFVLLSKDQTSKEEPVGLLGFREEEWKAIFGR